MKTVTNPKPMPRIRLLMLLTIAIAVATSTRGESTGPTGRWTNSLGMVFVQVPHTPVRFCIWETRMVDYAAFVDEGQWGRLWPQSPGFPQTTNDPVVNVPWEDAKDFCIWLTQMERNEGKISKTQVYRLPTDAEWSLAAGLPIETGETAEKKSHDTVSRPATTRDLKQASIILTGVTEAGNFSGKGDGFEFTSPVGSFHANTNGLYDMAGNVWEWCVDIADDGRRHVLRGGSWSNAKVSLPRRDYTLPDNLIGNFGFRCVLSDSVGRP